MLQNKALWVIVIGVLILGAFSIFVVDEREVAIKFQLGRIVRSDYEPGIYVKFPFVENVLKFDRRIQTLDSDPELYLTSEKKNVKVDSFVKWRISDVERFYTATGASLLRASDRLSTIIQKRLKDAFGRRTVNEVVSGERAEIMTMLTTSTAEQAKEFGLEVVDVRIKRIDLPEEVSTSVFQRMSAERQEVAKEFRSRGEEAARTIRAKANRDREVILAEADRDGQRIRGAGDGKAAEIYADAFGTDQSFFSLYRSLNAYKNTFQDRSDILLLQPNTEFFRFFNTPKDKR